MANNPPLQIGITGGIGSGKSLITRVFSALGIPIYDADTRARWLMTHHIALRQEIEAQFGTAAYLPDGTLNRAYMAAKVFNHTDNVTRINALVHPRVGEDYAAWVLAYPHAPYLLKEAALMYESNSYQLLHYTITVYAPLELRLRRVLQRDPQRTEQGIQDIIAKQLTEEERLSKADFVIYNDESQMVLPQVLALHERFIAEVR
ncbi:MAG: dephospho-CoA kinase [Bacteroidota bacterium]